MKFGTLCVVSCLALLAGSAEAGPIYGNTSAAQLVGTLAAGQAYTVSAAGTVSLCGGCNGGGSLAFNPNGTVANVAQGAYAPFNNGPLDHDPSQPANSPNYYGFYGPGVYLGALYGSFTATPASAADLFLLGSSYTIAAGSARTLYAVVNDSYYPDNPVTAFTVTLDRAAAGAVPEPASWAMMIAGFGLAATALRRRRPVVARG